MKKELLYGSLILPVAAGFVSCKGEKQDSENKPNVIVILADDLGYGDMSAYGSKAIQTPNLDFLAKNGVQFTDGHSTSATSTPSRYGLFTGQYPWRNEKAKILPGDAPLLIDVNQPTMPKMFQNAGYKTAAIGKWHLGMGEGNLNWNEQISPCANDIGFDYSNLIAATNDRVPTVYVRDGKVVGLDKNDPIEVNYHTPYEGVVNATTHPELMKMKWSHNHNQAIINGIPRLGYMKGGKAAEWVDEDMADYFVGEVAAFITENKDEPFFLYYGLHQPHVPRAPHSRFVGKTKLGPRGDAVAEADWCIGELIKKLEKEGLLENTIIYFSSDNGPILDDGYQDGAEELLGEHKPTGDFRGSKYSLYEAGTRVPMMMYWKGHIEPTVSNALVSQLDLYASFADLLGETMPEGLDTRNYLSTFFGENMEGRTSYIMEASGKTAYRKGNYVYIPKYKNKKTVKHVEYGTLGEEGLFDLSNDLGQRTNLAKENPELLKELREEYKLATGK